MKTHLLAAFYLIVISVFYFSIVGVLVGLFLLLTEPSLWNVIVLGVCAVVSIGYGIAMKLSPRFRHLVGAYFDRGVPPMA